MSTPELIKHIVTNFYTKAVADPIIGFQFRKIQEFSGDHPNRPPIEAFSSHIPRITNFWRMQLLGEKNLESEPFNLIQAHNYLGLKRGQVDRWVTLFKETLEESDLDDEFKTAWLEKLNWFRPKFP